MYQSNRARLSSCTFRSPWQKLKLGSGQTLAFVTISVAAFLGYCGVLAIFSLLLVMLDQGHAISLAGGEEAEVTVKWVYTHPWMETARIVGLFVILILVFRSRCHKKD